MSIAEPHVLSPGDRDRPVVLIGTDRDDTVFEVMTHWSRAGDALTPSVAMLGTSRPAHQVGVDLDVLTNRVSHSSVIGADGAHTKGPQEAMATSDGHPADDMPCVELVEKLTDYLEDALDPATVAAIETHLHACDGCTHYLDQLRTVIRSSRATEEPEQTEVLDAAVLDIFHAWWTTQRP